MSGQLRDWADNHFGRSEGVGEEFFTLVAVGAR